MKSHARMLYHVLERRMFELRVIALFSVTVSSAAMAAESRQTASGVESLYRAHRFSSSPQLNPNTTFRIRELNVPNLWSSLRLQLFEAEDMIGGDAFANRQFLCHEGVIHPFVESFGGQGVMSAIVHANALYYSYSWGSGIHRSLIGRLTIQDGKPVQQESLPLFHADMFVEADKGGRVRVVEGQWRGFNRWESPRPLGWIDFGEQMRLKIVDEQEREILQRR